MLENRRRKCRGYGPKPVTVRLGKNSTGGVGGTQTGPVSALGISGTQRGRTATDEHTGPTLPGVYADPTCSYSSLLSSLQYFLFRSNFSADNLLGFIRLGLPSHLPYRSQI